MSTKRMDNGGDKLILGHSREKLLGGFLDKHAYKCTWYCCLRRELGGLAKNKRVYIFL